MNQTTNVHFLFRNRQGNPDSTIREIFAFGIGNTGVLFVGSEIREIFACGIRNTGNFCLWDPEYGKFLFARSAIREIFACGIRYTRNLFVGSGIREIFVCGIRNRGFGISNSSSRNPEPR